MLRKSLITVALLVTVTPVMAQQGVSGYYGRRYERRYQPSENSSQGSAPTTDPQTAPERGSPNSGSAQIFTGQPSPTNLPNSNMKGFGNQSHFLNRPGASHDVGELSGQADSLVAKIMQAKSRGDLPGAAQANAALQNLLRQLTSIEPREAKWKVLKATTYINQAGGPSRSGTAGDRFSLQQAIRELDMAAACPNADQYRSQINSVKASTEAELSRRVERGKEIQRRGAQQFAEIYNMKGGNSSDSGGSSWCTTCGKLHGSGQCSFRRD